MKLILLILITVNSVFSCKCPPKKIISPCECDEVNDKFIH